MNSSEIKDWVLARGIDSNNKCWVLAGINKDGPYFVTSLRLAMFFKSSMEAWQFNIVNKCDCVPMRWLDCLREEVEK